MVPSLKAFRLVQKLVSTSTSPSRTWVWQVLQQASTTRCIPRLLTTIWLRMRQQLIQLPHIAAQHCHLVRVLWLVQLVIRQLQHSLHWRVVHILLQLWQAQLLVSWSTPSWSWMVVRLHPLQQHRISTPWMHSSRARWY